MFKDVILKPQWKVARNGKGDNIGLGLNVSDD
jgi:hypothetical protein